MKIADVTPAELAEVWHLNQESVPHVGDVDFAANAHHFRVARLNNMLAGYLIGMRPGLSYASPNYC